jgi:hypothetical protein
MRKDGGKTYVSTVFGWGPATYNSDGMYGMWEYLVYAGYSANKDPSIETNLFTQKTDNTISAGFHFSEFKAEIDAGRPVLVHVTDHTMLGYGYNDNNFNAPSIYVHDTWALGGGSMLWGGSYSNLDLWGVTCMTPTGGVVPLPPSVILLGSGLLGVLWGRKRFTQR